MKRWEGCRVRVLYKCCEGIQQGVLRMLLCAVRETGCGNMQTNMGNCGVSISSLAPTWTVG